LVSIFITSSLRCEKQRELLVLISDFSIIIVSSLSILWLMVGLPSTLHCFAGQAADAATASENNKNGGLLFIYYHNLDGYNVVAWRKLH